VAKTNGRPTGGVLAALLDAQPEELEQVRAEIRGTEDKLRQLKQAQRLLAAKFEPQDSEKAGKRATPGNTHTPMTAKEIGLELGESYAMVGRACKNHPWFHKMGNTFSVAKTQPATG